MQEVSVGFCNVEWIKNYFIFVKYLLSVTTDIESAVFLSDIEKSKLKEYIIIFIYVNQL